MTVRIDRQEPLAFYLLRALCSSPEDQSDESAPLPNRYLFLAGTVTLLVIAIIRFLFFR